MTPDQLRKQAAKERERARYHATRAEVLERTALELERLRAQEGRGSVFNEHMTSEAVKQRNVAISAAKAPGGLAELVRQKHGKSLNKYARANLRISPGSLSLYVNGKLPVPQRVYDRVREDVGFTDWPAGISTE